MGLIVDDETCDRCGPTVRAWIYVTLPSDHQLTYCGHCGRRYWDALLAQGAHIIDLTYLA